MSILSNNLQGFVGRVCTVMTVNTALQITEPLRHAQYFTGRVKSVDEYGIWLEHLQTKNRSFFMFPVVGIVEEQFIPEDDPRSSKIKEEMEKQKKPVAPPKMPPGQFIPVEQLTKIVKTTVAASSSS